MRKMTTLAALAASGLVLAGPARAQNSVPTWDRHFILDTAEGAHFEIDMGKIAARRAHTREARAAGRLMVKDHSGELHAVKALAASLGMKLPNHPSIQQRHEIADVSRHHGRAFDRSYARLEVADHYMDIESADGEINEGAQQDTIAFARKYREMYMRHLAVFQKLASDVGA